MNPEPWAPREQVQKRPMRDHTAPPFQALVDFCEAATAFLNAGAKTSTEHAIVQLSSHVDADTKAMV